MRRVLWAVFLCAAAVVLASVPSASDATPIGPNCGTCQGSTYELSYSGSPISTTATTETFEITYTIDTSGYNGNGVFLNTVALKVASSFVDATLVSAPGGVANWAEMFGGLSQAGCTGSGSGYDCVRWQTTLSLSPGVPNATPYVWVFDIEVPTGTLFTGLDQASVKARYVDAYGSKRDALVSENITLTNVPEPRLGLLALALPSLALWVRARRRL